MPRFYRYLDTVGDGTGNFDAVGNYVAATPFLVTAGAGVVLHLHRMIITIQDTGTLDAGKYGNNIVLTNGISVLHCDPDGSTLVDLTAGHPVKTNAEWGQVMYDVKDVAFGAGDNYISCRWTFTEAGAPLILTPGQSLRAIMHDDFTGLNGHHFNVQGLVVH